MSVTDNSAAKSSIVDESRPSVTVEDRRSDRSSDKSEESAENRYNGGVAAGANGPERILELLEDARSRHAREDLLLHSGILDQIETVADMKKLGLDALIERQTSMAVVYDYLDQLLATGTPWIHSYVGELAEGDLPASAVARAILLTADNPWAAQAFDTVLRQARERGQWQDVVLEAMEGNAAWVSNTVSREIAHADPDELADMIADRLLVEYDYQVAADNPKRTIFDQLLADERQGVSSAAVRFLLSESHLVHPDGVVWTTDALMNAYDFATGDQQIQMIGTLGDVMESRLEPDQWGNLGQVGNVTAMTSLLHAGLESADPRVRETAEQTVSKIWGDMDREALRNAIQRDQQWVKYVMSQVGP